MEFLRRINGLGTIAEVREIIRAARYMVLGLGDVYLGAPCAYLSIRVTVCSVPNTIQRGPLPLKAR